MCATDCAIPPKDFLGKIYTDSLVHSRPSLDLLVEVIGKNRVILGSDYPFPLGELNVGHLIETSDYDDELKVKTKRRNFSYSLSLSLSLFPFYIYLWIILSKSFCIKMVWSFLALIHFSEAILFLIYFYFHLNKAFQIK